ncbi:MAG: hypothetical protein OEX04_17495, partial [Acidimicrobiia bacterium]|nr:hypothetical protein [Acidimicrobiia bacterium]
MVKAVIRGIASAVVKAPWVLIALALALTVVFGLVSAGADRTTGQEGFAPDNPEIDASNTIQELFGADAAESVMQVIVRSESGDVLTAEALGSVNAAIGNLLSGEAG